MWRFLEKVLVFTICVVIELYIEAYYVLQLLLKKGLKYGCKEQIDEEDVIDEDIEESEELNYDIHWTDSKPLLFCISVGPHLPYLWSRQIDGLSEHYLVVPLDFNILVKKHFKRRHFKLKILAEHCVDVAYSLGKSEFSVMAHGIGVHLAWALGHLHPRRVKKIIMISGAYPALTDEKQCLTWKSPFSASQRLRCFIQLPIIPELSYFIRPFEESRLFGGLLSQCSFEVEDKAIILKEFCKDYYISWLHYMRNVSNPLPFRQDLIIPSEVRVSCPVLFILGEKDQAVTLQDVCHSGQYVEKFHCKVVEGCGSHPHWENPKEVNSCIFGFLEGVPTLPTPRRQDGINPMKDL